MAGGYVIDPATGQPSVQTATGAFLPLPMGADELSAMGLAPGAPPRPDVGPDLRLADNSGATNLGSPDPAMAQFIADQNRQDSVADVRAQLAPAAQQPQAHPSQADRFSQLDQVGQGQPASAPRGPAVDPSTLARPGSGGAPQQGAPTQGGQMDPLVQQVFEESLRGGGGGGGPRKLGVTSETHKYTQSGPVDPATLAAISDTRNAREGYDLAAAQMADERRARVYQAEQAEAETRALEVQARYERFQAQQRELAAFQTKRDAVAAEAAQMKVPEAADYWQSAGTVAKLTAGLSMVFGGALAGLQGGPNRGMEAVNQQVNSWIGEQRERYERKGAQIRDMDTQFGRLVQQFGSENVAEQVMREQAYAVRDNMLMSYAKQMGTPQALEVATQAQLVGEEQRAQAAAAAQAAASVEIEQKLAMQGGGGGGAPTLLSALEKAARAKKASETITGGDKEPERAITEGTTDKIGGALTTVLAARGVKNRLSELGVMDDDTDDPRSGAYDYVSKNIPGTQTRRAGQDLDQDTFDLARGAQQFLGKSDNDAALAEKQAQGLGASGRERYRGADRLEKKAVTELKLAVSGMTPAQRSAWFRALPPGERAVVQEALGQDNRPAASEQGVR